MAAHGIVGVQLALLVLWVKTPQRTSASVPASVLGLVVSLTLVILTIYEHKKSIKPSPVISTYLFFLYHF